MSKLYTILAKAKNTVTAAMKDDWPYMTENERKAYAEKHPASPWAKKINAPYKDKAEKEGRVTRGPKALGDKPAAKKPASKPAAKKPAAKGKRVPKELSPQQRKEKALKIKERIKKAEARIKALNDRIEVLAAEKTYRGIARGLTRRPETKERIGERIKRIGELTKMAKIRIKEITKKISELQKAA